MELSERINAFVQLGEQLYRLSDKDRELLQKKIRDQNPWFTSESVDLAMKGILSWLTKEQLENWASHYHTTSNPKRIGIAMAGNIPMVGFHDFLCVLISGHQIKLKLSSSDSILIPFVFEKLTSIEPRLNGQVESVELLKNIDGLLATGSDNTARYFEYYFKDIPYIIRKNRSSCAILMGDEDQSSLTELGKDIYSYFGLGCRNVSKIFVPAGYSIPILLDALNVYQPVINHHKYANNYDYHKAILLMNGVSFFDNGFSLLTENKSLISPLANIYFEFYENQDDLREKINNTSAKLQCIVSAKGWFAGSVDFGQAQFPELDDYADKIDTMKFLAEL